MNFFEDQINLRKQKDDEAFSESIINIASSVMGPSLAYALNGERRIVRDSIDEVMHFYHIKSADIPDGMTDINEQLEYLMRPYGIMRRTVTLSKGWYKDAIGAMLGTRSDDGSIVALIPDSISGYTFLDKNSGKRVRITSRNENLIDTEAMAFYKPFPLKKLGVNDLIKYMLQTLSVSDIALYLTACLGVSLVGLLIPRINNYLFSDVVSSQSTTALWSVAVFMLCVILSSMLLSSVKELYMNRIQSKMDLSVEAATMMRILSLPADFFKKYSSGELSTYAGNINSLCDMIMSTVASSFITALFSLVYVVSIFSYAPALVVPALCVLMITVLVNIITTLMQTKINKQRMKSAAKENGLSYALITGIQKIKLAGAEKRAFAKWGNLYAEEARLLYEPIIFVKLNSVISVAVSLIGTIVMYYMAVTTGVSVADYYSFNTAYGMVSAAFMSLSGVAIAGSQIKPVIDMARPLLETEPEIAEGKEVITRVSGSIELDSVSFKYSENTPVILDNISLKIKAGQYVAIVGKTGCGKSTLLRLLLGFEIPQKGSIYYDKRDMKNIDLKSLRRKIGVVMQNGKLFSGDIFSNITVSAPWLTLDDAWEAAEIAGIADDIRKMPMGMNTIISEGSGGISGGQKQRLMIARAVAPKPKIIFLDEATSALDNITQRKVSDALDSMKCTRVVIAHRLSTIKQCDRIIVLDGGRIIEDGNYESLIAKNGFFAELVARQRVDV